MNSLENTHLAIQFWEQWSPNCAPRACVYVHICTCWKLLVKSRCPCDSWVLGGAALGEYDQVLEIKAPPWGPRATPRFCTSLHEGRGSPPGLNPSLSAPSPPGSFQIFCRRRRTSLEVKEVSGVFLLFCGPHRGVLVPGDPASHQGVPLLLESGEHGWGGVAERG